MTDGHDRNYEAGVDREIHIKGIVVTGIVLAAVVVASAVLMWFMSKGLLASLEGSDPPPPVLQEARTQEPPPEPLLQTSPLEDMAVMRAEESEALDTWGWVDEAGGIARVPIERAMEMVANREVPAVAAAPDAAPMPAMAAEPGAEPEAATTADGGADE